METDLFRCHMDISHTISELNTTVHQKKFWNTAPQVSTLIYIYIYIVSSVAVVVTENLA
jgi:hypothetical protein